MRSICAAAAALAITAAAHAQWISSITKPLFGVNPPEVYLNNNDGSTQFLLDPEALGVPASAPGFTGLAADEATRRLFATTTNGTTSGLYAIDYDTLTPTLLSNTQRPDGSGGIVLDGLAFDTARNTLFGTRVLGGSTGSEGLYSINPATGATTLLLEYETTATSVYSIGGIDYDPQTDRVYLLDEDSTGGRWIYSVDPSNPGAGLTEVLELPSFITDVDGLGAGDGQLFLMTDGPDTNNGMHHIIDIATGQIVNTIATPYPPYAGSPIVPNPSGGGAYAPGIPEPATAALLAIALLALRRR